MPTPSFALVTSTTEIIRGVSRVRVNEAYTHALATAGLVPIVLPPIDEAMARAALSDAVGLVLTGGEDIDPALFGESRHAATGEAHARRDAYELALAEAARDRRIPTLAICRGAQVMNVALGGSLVQDIPTQRASQVNHDPEGRRAERVHRVQIDASSRLATAIGATSIAANSSHHQAVDRVAAELRVVAASEDGVVEAIEPLDANWWMIGVQWHPEELTTTLEDWDRRLFASFSKAVHERGRD
ncbi:MAG TPA: gamma-glutamyl-gamma-aminobutyrate hydrolase family protein [Gemmatimonadaceae bacterium]|nr:gamma-glutamyl-gamma-aminobutyrate hydrolase family protein [Gemmatimonadaceae bacterium]